MLISAIVKLILSEVLILNRKKIIKRNSVLMPS